MTTTTPSRSEDDRFPLSSSRKDRLVLLAAFVVISSIILPASHFITYAWLLGNPVEAVATEVFGLMIASNVVALLVLGFGFARYLSIMVSEGALATRASDEGNAVEPSP